MQLPKSLSSPFVSVDVNATIADAVETMVKAHIGAVGVMERGRLKGIFSERDLMMRVVAEKKNPATLKVEEVMTSPVITITDKISLAELLRLMHENHIRHLPVVDHTGHPKGMVSMRDVLECRIDQLDQENESLAAFLSADGPGG